MHHQVSNKAMRVPPRLKFSAGPHDYLHVRKNDEHIKPRLGSLRTKFIHYDTYWLASRSERRMKTEVTALAGRREKKYHEEKGTWDRYLIFIQFSYRSSNTWFFAECVLTSSRLGVRPHFGALPKMGVATFNCLHVVASGVQLLSLHCRVQLSTNSFPAFPPAPTLYSFPFWLKRPIRTRCYLLLNLGVPKHSTLKFGQISASNTPQRIDKPLNN